MKIDFIKEIDRWFKEYTSQYRRSEEIKVAINVKIAHTERVVNEMNALSDALGLQDDDMHIAVIIARLHDVGRFPQFARYGTYSDRQSEDHAKLGLKVIEENKLLDELQDEEKNLIVTAIANHNRFAIDDGLDARALMFCRMIRDADKLDILKVLHDTEHYGTAEEKESIFIKLPDTHDYNQTILKTLSTGVMGRAENIRSLNDFRLIALGWVYDLNFKHSLVIFKQRSYIDRLAELLPDTDDVMNAVDCVRKYLDEAVDS